MWEQIFFSPFNLLNFSFVLCFPLSCGQPKANRWTKRLIEARRCLPPFKCPVAWRLLLIAEIKKCFITLFLLLLLCQPPFLGPWRQSVWAHHFPMQIQLLVSYLDSFLIMGGIFIFCQLVALSKLLLLDYPESMWGIGLAKAAQALSFFSLLCKRCCLLCTYAHVFSTSVFAHTVVEKKI